jgi:gluconate 5-dehydrogenase
VVPSLAACAALHFVVDNERIDGEITASGEVRGPMSLTLFELKEKNVFLSGSSAGLGLTLARGLGAAGARVFLNGRNEEKLRQAVDQLRQSDIQVEGYAFDVANPEAVRATISNIQREQGGIDILVNNAGIQRRGPLEEIALEDWREVLDVNVTAPFLLSKAVVPDMRRRGGGKIINICSLMSEIGRVTTGPYTTSKGGLKMLTRAMAVEWAKDNIQVNAIGPGYFVTEMTRKLAEDAQFNTWLTRRTPAGRWGEPDELVGAAVFLASAASSFVSGQVIYVDGGLLAAL